MGRDYQFWSDDFDMDLLAIIPDASDLIGQTADMPLYVHGGTTHGRLNHPCVWNDYEHDMIAYFSIDPTVPSKPRSYHADREIIECTVLEAFRDAWPHHYAMNVDGVIVWDTVILRGLFDRIMFHTRGWKVLPESQFSANVSQLRQEIRQATRRLRDCVSCVYAADSED